MSKESAIQFAQEVMEDTELRDRTAKLKPEEVLSIAKEMGYDFTEEELTAAMNEDQELTADDLETAAGGAGSPGQRSQGQKRKLREELAKHCNHDINGPLHQWVKTGHEERWMLWAWTRGYDLFTCTLCGATKEEKV